MTINQANNSTIVESVNPKSLSEKDLLKIAEIEQDMWAREESIWEYVKCNDCNKIYSKEDMYDYLSNDIKSQTVKKIEEIISCDIVCNECSWIVTSIYDTKTYVNEIIDRYKNSDSFLTICRDNTWEIRWFFDGYVWNFETIYEREFEHYYSKIWKDWLKSIIEKNTNKKLPSELLMCSALWMEDKYRSFYSLYDMMRTYFKEVYDLLWEKVMWIYESAIWTNTHSIYHVAWWQQVWISSDSNLYSQVTNTQKWHVSDIFLHENIAKSFISKMELPPRKFLKENKTKMKEVLVAA